MLNEAVACQRLRIVREVGVTTEAHPTAVLMIHDPERDQVQCALEILRADQHSVTLLGPDRQFQTLARLLPEFGQHGTARVTRSAPAVYRDIDHDEPNRIRRHLETQRERLIRLEHDRLRREGGQSDPLHADPITSRRGRPQCEVTPIVAQRLCPARAGLVDEDHHRRGDWQVRVALDQGARDDLGLKRLAESEGEGQNDGGKQRDSGGWTTTRHAHLRRRRAGQSDGGMRDTPVRHTRRCGARVKLSGWPVRGQGLGSGPDALCAGARDLVACGSVFVWRSDAEPYLMHVR